MIATAGLILVIFALARSGRLASAPAAVGAYIGAAYWFTSSTSFANPAITIGRMFSNTFAGIAPSSVPVFIAAQIGGGVAGVILIRVLYPALTPAQAAGVIVPHEADDGAPRRAEPPGNQRREVASHAHRCDRRQRRRDQRRAARQAKSIPARSSRSW